MISPTVKSKLPYGLCLLILLIMCSVYYAYMIDKLPMGVHEWAQADRLSIAYRFFDDGMNFFRPATFNMEPLEGVVGVEFPIQAYLAASFAHLFGRGSISTCFRLIDIGIMCTGLMFLFHTVYKRTLDFALSISPVMFVACIPTYLYYAGNYLPDAASVSITFIGFAFLWDYFDNPDRQRPLFLALFWLTIATMLKTTSINYLGFVMAFCFFSRLLKYRTLKSVVPLSLVCFGCLLLEAANLGMMQYLHIRYDSWLFTTTVHPFDSWEGFISFIENNYKVYWMTEYLSLPQYTVYVFIIVAGFCLGLTYNKQRLGWLMLMFLLCALVFAYLFGGQFKIHDYYVMSIFYPLLVFALTLSILNLHKAFAAAPPKLFKAVRVAFPATMLLLFFFTDHQLYQRQTASGPYWSPDQSFSWMQNGAQTLDSLHIPKEEQIIGLDENSPNLTLVYFDRKGYNLDKPRWNGNSDFAAIWMRERHISLAVCKEETVRRIMNDSSFTRNFNILSLKDNKGVIRLKPKS